MDIENYSDMVGPDFDSLREHIDFSKEGMTEDQFNIMQLAYAQNQQQNMIDHNYHKLIDCPREIIFKVEGTVYNQNSEQEVIATEEIFDQTYHIPVPSGCDYKPYIQSFMEHFVSSLEKTAKKSWDEANNNE